MDACIELINSMGRVFVGFAWLMLLQSGVLIAILLFADYLLHKKVRAVFRYWLWMLVLVKLVLPTSLSSPVSMGRFTGEPMASINISGDIQPVAGDISNVPNQSLKTDKITKSLLDSSPATTIHNPPVKPAASLAWQGGVLLVWLAVVIAMVLLLLQRVFFVCGLVRQSSEANNEMKDTLGFCSRAMGVKRTIGLKVSPNATSPAVCGLLRPVILLPQGISNNLDSSQFRVVLMHELAHVKRGDLWANLVQTLLQIAYFYNPMLWLANWLIRRTREQAVDEAVQVALGEKAQQYPETLLNVARLAFERPALSLRLVGVVESKSALAGRIKRMLTRPIPKTAKLGITGLLAVLLLAAVLLPMAKAKDDGTVDNYSTVTAGENISVDIGIEDFDIQQYPEGGLYTVTVSIRNKGSAESPSFGVYFYRGDPNEVKPMTHGAGPIKAGDVWREGSMPFALKEGTNEITVILDPTDEIGESNETDNEASMKVVVKDGRIVDKEVLPSFAAKRGVVGIGPGWQKLQRVIGDNYRGSIGGYSDDERKCSEYFEKVLSWARPGGSFVIMFAFDEENFGHSQMVPEKYENLLPIPWEEIRERVINGEVLELKGKARGLDTIILAAPTLDQLNELIQSTELLRPFETSDRQGDAVGGPEIKNEIPPEAAQPVISAAEFGDDNSDKERTGPPVVVKTNPGTYADDVSPDLNKLMVTFNQPMADKSWAWVRWDAPYPETTGSPSYDTEKRTCTLPVKLEPGKAYLVAFNIEPYIGFVNAAGEPARPYVLVFATKDKDGKPTPIPKELLAKAKSVNDKVREESSQPGKRSGEAGKIPYTQITYDDVRPDGTIFFKNTIREINRSGKEITTVPLTF